MGLVTSSLAFASLAHTVIGAVPAVPAMTFSVCLPCCCHNNSWLADMLFALLPLLPSTVVARAPTLSPTAERTGGVTGTRVLSQMALASGALCSVTVSFLLLQALLC